MLVIVIIIIIAWTTVVLVVEQLLSDLVMQVFLKLLHYISCQPVVRVLH